jgi:hypothetical protein
LSDQKTSVSRLDRIDDAMSDKLKEALINYH